jgi:hypothetical protein
VGVGFFLLFVLMPFSFPIVCMQSSSTTTSITVSLVGAGAISVASGIYVSAMCLRFFGAPPSPPPKHSLTIPFLRSSWVPILVGELRRVIIRCLSFA